MISHDVDIRKQLSIFLANKYQHCPEVLILDELSCCQGAARVDIAVITNQLHGFEIKSEKDTLERLSFQAQAYNEVFNSVTLVTTRKHLDDISTTAPAWWGIWEAVDTAKGVKFVFHRHSKANPDRNPIQVASLLWKSEVTAILRDLGFSNIKSKWTRYDLWSLLVQNIELDELTELVGKTLISRDGWRSVGPQKSGGDSSRRVARSRRSRVKLARSRSPVYIGHPS